MEEAVDNRLAELERRVAALESARLDPRQRQAPAADPDRPDTDPADTDPADAILDTDWTSHASALAALGHPVRLTLLREILRGRTTVNALSEVEGLGTSGQIYHHLRQLTAEGWLHTPSRGVFAVPPARVAALLAILVAVER
ncbi:ArsR/SmtB family transcription factor [Kribbella sp. CA-253562]|uniref:ArsR/SmtB family transcription factor n=1 Tax=Kribbella sp. CA-253562 TaxID=3239942 RepID=UPI003D8BBB6E